MDDILIGNIVRAVRTVNSEDSIGRAAETLRNAGLTELPVVSGNRVIGMVREEAVLGALASGDPMSAAARPVSDIVSTDIMWINRYMSVCQVAEMMNERGVQVSPVADEYGSYLGIVSRLDLAGAMCRTTRPPVIGGLATPLGVHLTCGNHRAGAGDLGLFLTGVGLMVINLLAFWIIFGLAYLIDKSNLLAPWSLWAIMQSPAVNIPNWMDALKFIVLFASLPIFLLLLRASSVAGFHAAEHQVVHAIENGEPLKHDKVSRMPRVHPRCGTNIFAGVIVFMMIREIISDDIAVLLAVFVIVFAWKTIGSYFQYYVTTKPATARQIDSGIKAGESLLAKYRLDPARRVTGWQRIWNTGMPQVLLGSAATVTIAQLLRLTPPGF